jgi:hypothetical protein
MKLEIEEIRLRVDTTEDERSAYCKLAERWDKMYRLDPDFAHKDAISSVLAEGKEQVITPDPYDVVQLAIRQIASKPKIDIPPKDADDTAVRTAGKVEQWLTAMYERVNWHQGGNFVEDVKLSVFKLGKGYLEAKWIKDDLPKDSKRFPIMIRSLDPRNVGFKRTAHGVEYAYHIREVNKLIARREYPALKKWEKPALTPDNRVATESELVTIVDFWYVDGKTGKVWNAITVDDEFGKESVATDYPMIPIIEIVGESNGMSILHAIDGLWQYKCRLASSLATGVLWYTWPFFAVSHPMGVAMDDITVRPGATVNVAEGTVIQEVKPQANVGIVEAMLAKIEKAIQQATFPGVMYGDAGGMQAGYGINILSQHASGRVAPARDSLERGLQWLNELVLALIDQFDDDNKGVELWGRDEGSEKLYKLCIYKKDIDGYYENAVRLILNTPQDDQAMQTLWLRLVDSKIISPQTFRDKALRLAIPSDEEDRVLAAQAKQHPDIMKKETILMYMRQNPNTWEAILKGTEFEQMAYQMAYDALGIEPPEGQPEPPQEPQMPMQPPMPPMGPPMMPPPPGPMPIQPGAALIPPLGGGIPPEMQGQMQGESLGLDPAMNPALFAQMMGQPMGAGDELRALLPPGAR